MNHGKINMNTYADCSETDTLCGPLDLEPETGAEIQSILDKETEKKIRIAKHDHLDLDLLSF